MRTNAQPLSRYRHRAQDSVKHLLAAVCALLCLGQAADAAAQFELDWGGRVQTDIRFRLNEKALGDYWQRFELPVGVDRNENIFKLKLNASADRFGAVVDVDFVVIGIDSGVHEFGDLTQRRSLDPFRIEFHSAYIEAFDLFVDGFDVRLGMQKMMWGMGDQFNPTNNLNADDVEDPLLFGDQQANIMLRIDYSPVDELQLTAALVPIFRPALLPASAMLGIAAVDRQPAADLDVVHRLVVEQRAAELPFDQTVGYPTVVGKTQIDMPDMSYDNMQFGFQLQTIVGDQDIALNYYYGRNDVPIPIHNHTTQVFAEGGPYTPNTDGYTPYLCDPNDSDRCISGLLQTETTLGFPRMQVVGFNMAGEFDLLGWISDDISPIGYRFELGLFIPQRSVLTLSNDPLNLHVTFPFLCDDNGENCTYTNFEQPGGEYDYGPDGPPEVVTDQIFAKWSLGLDYTFNEHLYLNVQWVHGLFDEFGAGDFITEGWSVVASDITTDLGETIACALPQGDELADGSPCARELLRPRLGDYLVVGVDMKFLNQNLLLRIFALFYLNGTTMDYWDDDAQARRRTHYGFFTEEGFSAVIFPQLTYNFGYGFDASVGALIKLGTNTTKFGDPAAGGSIAFMQGRFSF